MYTVCKSTVNKHGEDAKLCDEVILDKSGLRHSIFK